LAQSDFQIFVLPRHFLVMSLLEGHFMIFCTVLYAEALFCLVVSSLVDDDEAPVDVESQIV